MMTTVAAVVGVAVVVLAAVVMVLKKVAPMTKTTADDKLLTYAEDAEAVAEKAQEYLAPEAAPAPSVAPATK